MPHASPYQLSPAHHALARRGAAWADHHGWRIAASYGSPARETEALRAAGGFCDLSHLPKLECNGSQLDAHLPAVLSIDSLPLPGSGVISGGVCAYRFTRDQLLLCGASTGSSIPRVTEGPDTCLHCLDRTAGLLCYLIAGPCSIHVLNRLTSLDLRESRFPNLSCARASLARVNTWMARCDLGSLSAFRVFAGREYGEYLCDVILETGGAFGLAPVGLEALAHLEPAHV